MDHRAELELRDAIGGDPALVEVRVDAEAVVLALGRGGAEVEVALSLASARRLLTALARAVAIAGAGGVAGNAPRQSHEPPPVVARRGWRFHHLGIPTAEVRPDEVHLPQFGLHVAGFPTSPYGIEWMRFDPDCPLHPLITSVPHLAFEVDDLDAALVGEELIYPPGEPSDGVRAAMIAVDGAPVELIWFRDNNGRGAG